jgi:hypothetical protein
MTDILTRFHTCRWPIGDPRSPDFRFCEVVTQPGKSYCARHAAIAYQPHPTAPSLLETDDRPWASRPGRLEMTWRRV